MKIIFNYYYYYYLYYKIVGIVRRYVYIQVPNCFWNRTGHVACSRVYTPQPQTQTQGNILKKINTFFELQ